MCLGISSLTPACCLCDLVLSGGRSGCCNKRALHCRRQIDGLKDAMNASAVAGVEGAIARRIAADEGREYILQVHKCMPSTILPFVCY